MSEERAFKKKLQEFLEFVFSIVGFVAPILFDFSSPKSCSLIPPRDPSWSSYDTSQPVCVFQIA